MPAPAARRRLNRAAPQPMRLEQRLMFDGAAVDTTSAVVQDAAHAGADAATKALIPVVPPALEVRSADPSQDNGHKEVVFVDTAIANYKTLEAGIRAGVGIVEPLGLSIRLPCAGAVWSHHASSAALASAWG